MVEFAIVLAVIGIVMGALWGVVGLVRENVRRETMMEQMTTIVGKIRDYYLGRACASVDFSCAATNAVLTDHLINNGVLLPEQYRKGTNPRLADHPWGGTDPLGTLYVQAVADGTMNFLIRLSQLKRSSCTALAGSLSSIGAPSGLIRIDINGTANIARPVAPEVAAGICNGNDTIYLFYNLRA